MPYTAIYTIYRVVGPALGSVYAIYSICSHIHHIQGSGASSGGLYMPNLAYCTLRNEMKLNEKKPDTLRNEPIAINSNECSLERFPDLPYAARQVKQCVSPQYERRKAKSRKKKSPKQTCREKKRKKREHV